MQLAIGEVIYKLRKENRVTQEQLANAVGVSVPAVSKWESGGAYPDITLLPSIARYFNTSIDCLLKYEKDLSNDDVIKITDQCSRSFEENSFEDAVRMCESFLRDYPNSMLLKLRAGSMYMTYLSKASDKEDMNRMIKRAIALLEQSALSTEDEISHTSNYLLSTLYSMDGDNLKAEEVLSKIPKSKLNPDDMLVSIYMAQKKYEQARKLIHNNIWEKLSSIILEIARLSTLCQMENSAKYAEELLFLQRQVIKLFEVEPVFLQSNSLHLAEYHIKQQNKEKALEYIEEFAGCIFKLKSRDLSGHKMFGSMKFAGTHPSEKFINSSVVKLFEQNPEFDFIRDDERFQEILKRFKG
jgi:transcriptional regulator with XRE-family HTH domain